jgi:hypothetical protein
MRSALALLLLPLVGCEEPPDEPYIVDAYVEDVVFRGTDFDLEGTFHVPQHWSDYELPSVVIMPGDGIRSRLGEVSGQLNMDFGFSIDTSVQLAEGLALQGLAVLRYDKRNCGTWNGRCENSYPELKSDLELGDIVDDGACAWSWISSQPEIARNKVTLVGDGQSAAFMAEALNRRLLAAGGVMLGAPASAPDDWLQHRIDARAAYLLATGVSQEDVDAELAPSRAVVEDLRALEAGTFEGESIDGLPVSYWDSYFQSAERQLNMMRAVYRPVLALQGDADLDVPASAIDAWRDAFAETPSLPHEARTLPCVTHALNCVSEPDPLLFEPADASRDVAQSVVDAIADFALDR